MFGYVRAVTPVLAPEEARRYEAVYCGLCRTLGAVRKDGQLILNYDFVFPGHPSGPARQGEPFPTAPVPSISGERKPAGWGLLPWTLRRTPR